MGLHQPLTPMNLAAANSLGSQDQSKKGCQQSKGVLSISPVLKVVIGFAWCQPLQLCTLQEITKFRNSNITTSQNITNNFKKNVRHKPSPPQPSHCLVWKSLFGKKSCHPKRRHPGLPFPVSGAAKLDDWWGQSLEPPGRQLKPP